METNRQETIPQGYKATALGVIPQEWEVKRLGDICTYFKSGEGITSKDISANGQYPVYGGNGLRGYTDKKYTHDGAYILIGRQGALCGNINYVTGKCYISEHAIAVQAKGDLLWLRYKLDFWNLNRYSESSAQPGLSVEKLVRYKLAVPPLGEQRKIAEVLGVWDLAIAKQVQLVERLTQRKRALMQRLLTAKLRLPGFSAPWKKVKLGEIGKFDKGYGVPKECIKNTGNKAITYGEIYTKHDFVIKKFTSYIDDETAAISKKITQGAILFTGSGETLEDIGKCVAFIDNDIAYAGGDIIIFNPSIKINSLVLSYCLNSAPVNAQKTTYGQGHSVVHIYQKDLAKLQVFIPSFSEQTAIAEVLTAADREIELAQAKLELYRRQKRGLMQQLLTGKKRIKYE